MNDYNNNEKQSMKFLGNRIIQALRPCTFLQFGFQFEVKSEIELLKFVDTMHENRLEGTFRRILGGITVDEFELVKNFTKQVLGFSDHLFNKKRIATSSVLSSINIFRYIKYLFGETKLKIFEIGPGCGYLGAMLMLEGHKYLSTDVSQAFYIYQNKFWHYLFGEKFVELALTKFDNLDSFKKNQESSLHIPWWIWSQLKPQSLQGVDVVICNHALNEMHPNALTFTLAMARSMLKGPGKKVFLFEGRGASLQGNEISLIEAFYRAGFVLVHKDYKITAFVTKESQCSKNHANVKELLGLKNRLTRSLIGFLGLRDIKKFLHLEVKDYYSKNNVISLRIIKERKKFEKTKKISVDDLKDFYKTLLGDNNILNQDELFLSIK